MKKTFIFIFICIVLLSLFGCQNENVQSDDYNMKYAAGAQQYCMFINKQINVAINQLSSNIDIANQVVHGSYILEDAIETAEQSIKKIEAARKEVEKMMPPDRYIDERKHTVELMSNAENDLKTYIDKLKTGADCESIKTIMSVMQLDFSALTSEFNTYYE